jgi:hypothetical protein
MMPFRVLCLIDSAKPENIPNNKWVKKDSVYTVVQVDRLHLSGGTLGYKLYELNIDDCFPYTYFGAWRFAVIADQLDTEEEIEELIDNLLEEANAREEIEIRENALLDGRNTQHIPGAIYKERW